jgi:hypothetical protein
MDEYKEKGKAAGLLLQMLWPFFIRDGRWFLIQGFVFCRLLWSYRR